MREKTAQYVFDKYEMLEQNSQQRNTRGNREGVSMEMASQMSDMSRNIETLMSRFGKQPTVANQVFMKENHGMDMYPRVEPMPPTKEEIQVVHPSRQSRQLDDPFSNTYNPGWARHPNLNYRNNHCLNPQFPQ